MDQQRILGSAQEGKTSGRTQTSVASVAVASPQLVDAFQRHGDGRPTATRHRTTLHAQRLPLCPFGWWLVAVATATEPAQQHRDAAAVAVVTVAAQLAVAAVQVHRILKCFVCVSSRPTFVDL